MKWLRDNWTPLLAASSTIFAVLAVIGVFTFSHNKYDDWEIRSQFGEYVGGVATVAFSLLAALLVYLSFLQQFRANKIILDNQSQADSQKNFETALALCNDVLEESKFFSYQAIGNSEGKRYTSLQPLMGRTAIWGIQKDILNQIPFPPSHTEHILSYRAFLVFCLDNFETALNAEVDRDQRALLARRVQYIGYVLFQSNLANIKIKWEEMDSGLTDAISDLFDVEDKLKKFLTSSLISEALRKAIEGGLLDSNTPKS